MSTFSRFHPRLQDAIVSRLGWTSLRPVQELAGAALLDGHNAIVLAPTAGGKTEASIFPTLSRLLSEDAGGRLGALYIAPIKALLNNQAERLGMYTEMVGLRRSVRHGDVRESERRAFFREPTELLMTTPESLEVLLASRSLDRKALFGDLRVVIVDEIHALAGTDRGTHLLSVIERLALLTRHDIQRIGLSATVGNPADIATWLQGTSTRPSSVIDPPKVQATRRLSLHHRSDLRPLAALAARQAAGAKSLFFCQSRRMTEAVAEEMRNGGVDVFVHHSAVSREERELAEERFHRGQNTCIVCTSTLELGIDVGDLDLVLQAEAPTTVSSFLQRMGRTGRREGQNPNTSFFCESPEGVLQALALVELARRGAVESVRLEYRSWPVFLHQILAICLGAEGVLPNTLWNILSRVPDFRGIARPEFDALLAHLLREGTLAEVSGELLLGPRIERRYGGKNFLELYAVFSSPQSYSVETTTGRPLGSLSQDFVDRLVEGVSGFLLGGRAWSVHAIRHTDRRILVDPAPRGRQPTWGGFLPQFLGLELCQEIKAVLHATAEPRWLDPSALDVLRAERERMRGLVEPGPWNLDLVDLADSDNEDAASERAGEDRPLSQSDATPTIEYRWWTFAGGRINSTIKHALLVLGGDWKISSDNFALRIRGDLDPTRWASLRQRLLDPKFWQDPRVWSDLAAALPSWRLSKFQSLLPEPLQREVVSRYLLDPVGAASFLGVGPVADVAAAGATTPATATP